MSTGSSIRWDKASDNDTREIALPLSSTAVPPAPGSEPFLRARIARVEQRNVSDVTTEPSAKPSGLWATTPLRLRKMLIAIFSL
jgi:hypothetical protein